MRTWKNGKYNGIEMDIGEHTVFFYLFDMQVCAKYHDVEAIKQMCEESNMSWNTLIDTVDKALAAQYFSTGAEDDFEINLYLQTQDYSKKYWE